jgi:GNAT superfamily N-acetyltransferase
MPAAEVVELEAYAASFGVAEAAHTARIGGAVALAMPGAPTTMLNRVSGLGLAEPATEEHLDAIDEFFTPLAAQQYAIAIAPGAQPMELTGWLAERGFTSGYAWTKFSRGVEENLHSMTDLRVELVGPEAGADFALVVREAYELPANDGDGLAATPTAPGFSCFVAYAGDEPAAAGALVVRDATGWLGFGATRPAYRRRGGQSALFAARIGRARDLGVKELFTETGERVIGRPSNSYRNIVRAGFRPAYVRPNFLSPA